MTMMARLAIAATVLVAMHPLLVRPAKAGYHTTTQTNATQPQKSAVKCSAKCRQYGWPSYLLSFPPARSR
jgi:hypothetical protein